MYVSRLSAGRSGVVREKQEARAGAEADGRRSRHRREDDQGCARRGDPVGCREPASIRRFGSVFEEGSGAGRLGRILQADAYVKWYRSDEYYARPIKGSWAVEGGGALISQAIHQVDVLLYLIGAVDEVFGYWQLGAAHKIESEDCVCAVMRYASGATGVIQAATALWPGYPERVEIHGTKGSAIVTGDQLTTWDVRG